MKNKTTFIAFLFFLWVFTGTVPVGAQEEIFQVVDQTVLPAGLNNRHNDSCLIEFHEQWTIDARRLSISKQVEKYRVSCAGENEDLPPLQEALRLRDISYEFSFPDPHQTDSHRLQAAIIALIDVRYPVNKIYNMPAQLLSVLFHEEWVLEPAGGELRKKVTGITPLIWQQRRTEEGEPVNDGDTGLPVYFKLKLEKINLSHP
ncbi:MAG: hypothetical protein P1P86_05490 [Bacteroidales bacterium]|nr:hypothetical protein [Bacteroidales bacterium]